MEHQHENDLEPLEISHIEKRLQCHNAVVKILKKPLQSLPVGKDLPRLARKFHLFERLDGQDNASSNLKFSPVHFVDASLLQDMPMQQVIYYLLKHLYEHLFQKSATTTTTTTTSDDAVVFPTLDAYESVTNINDHTTFTDFLLKTFGEEHQVTRLLKATHQTVIINVLFHTREGLAKNDLNFKDARGQWHIFVYFPSTEQRQKKETDLVCVTQRRREQVYRKNAPNASEKNFSMFENMFQVEWEIRIWFDRTTMEVRDVCVHFLRALYGDDPENHMAEQQQHPDIAKYDKQVQAVKLIFDNLNIVEPSNVLQTPKTPSSPTVAQAPHFENTVEIPVTGDSTADDNASEHWLCSGLISLLKAIAGVFLSNSDPSETTPLRKEKKKEK